MLLDDITVLEELLARATPGPWHIATDILPDSRLYPHDIMTGQVSLAMCGYIDDAALIAALRNAAPELLAELRRLRAETATAVKLLEEVVHEDCGLYVVEPIRTFLAALNPPAIP